jgi:hypothetical protein
MIELIITVCALAHPSNCEEKHLQFLSQESLRQCVMSAPPYIAQWVNEHPQWSVARWRCDEPHARDKADAGGPARAA